MLLNLIIYFNLFDQGGWGIERLLGWLIDYRNDFLINKVWFVVMKNM